MYRKANPLFLKTETPTHPGSGSELGVVDLPIQREKHTAFPKIEASSLKGSIREAIERVVDLKTFASWEAADTRIQRLFGYDDGSLNDQQKDNLQKRFTNPHNNKLQNEFAGCIGFTDARLLLFPVKSMKGVFAWITCPKILQQFKNDLELAEVEGVPALPEAYNLVPKNSSLVLTNGDTKNVVLEEYAFEVKEDKATSQFCEWLAGLLFDMEKEPTNYVKALGDIVVLSNDEFKDFVSLSTEVITRTKINNVTGTVETGALFTEEYLPTETVLYTLALAAQEFTDKMKPMSQADVWSFFSQQLPEVMQIGGNASLGKGIVSTRLLPTKETLANEKATEATPQTSEKGGVNA